MQTKNTAARTPVVRDRKLAPPDAPNRLPELPLPEVAPPPEEPLEVAPLPELPAVGGGVRRPRPAAAGAHGDLHAAERALVDADLDPARVIVRVNAVGTAALPIIFTSRDNVLGLNSETSQGQWGALKCKLRNSGLAPFAVSSISCSAR